MSVEVSQQQQSHESVTTVIYCLPVTFLALHAESHTEVGSRCVICLKKSALYPGACPQALKIPEFQKHTRSIHPKCFKITSRAPGRRAGRGNHALAFPP